MLLLLTHLREILFIIEFPTSQSFEIGFSTFPYIDPRYLPAIVSCQRKLLQDSIHVFLNPNNAHNDSQLTLICLSVSWIRFVRGTITLKIEPHCSCSSRYLPENDNADPGRHLFYRSDFELSSSFSCCQKLFRITKDRTPQ